MSFRSGRIACALVVAAVVGVALIGGNSAGASTHGAKPLRGGTLVTMESSDTKTSWDPVALLGVPRYDSPGAFAIYDTLFYEDPTTLKLVGRLGTSLTSSDGGKTFTLKLRPKVQFSDGTAFDAAAVQFNWQRIADPTNKAVAAGAALAIQSTEVIDPLTLKVSLKDPDPNWNRRVSYTLSTIASPTALKTLGAGFATKPVGAGPFLLKEWIRSDHQTFVRNPNYWEKGKPYLDEIDHKFIADDTSRYNTFRTTSGSIDFLYDPTLVPQIRTDGYNVVSQTPNGGGWALTFQTQKPPFNDIRLRQAISMAIDVKDFNKRRRNGDPALLIDTLDKKGTPYFDPKLTVPKANLAAAQKIVDQVVAEQGGKAISFTFSYFNTGYGQLDAEVLQAQVQRLKNVEMKLESLTPSVLIAKFTSGDFQMYPSIPRWNEPAVDVVATFRSGSPANNARYSNPTVDSALTQLVTATDQKTRIQLVHTVEEQILKDVPVVFYTRYPSYTIIDKAVKGVVMYYDQRFLLDQIWIANKKS